MHGHVRKYSLYFMHMRLAGTDLFPFSILDILSDRLAGICVKRDGGYAVKTTSTARYGGLALQ